MATAPPVQTGRTRFNAPSDFLSRYKELHGKMLESVASNAERMTLLLSQQDTIISALRNEVSDTHLARAGDSHQGETDLLPFFVPEENSTRPNIPSVLPPDIPSALPPDIPSVLPPPRPSLLPAFTGFSSVAPTETIVADVVTNNEEDDVETRRGRRASIMKNIVACPTATASNDDKSVKTKHGHGGVFADVEQLKQNLREKVFQESDGPDRLHAEGRCQAIVQSTYFELMTFVMLACNAIWTGIDMELNPAGTILRSDAPFFITEMIFFVFFNAEWAVRFGAFREKKFALQDYPFLFDSCLVVAMWVEMWLLGLIFQLAGDAGTGTAAFSFLRLFRLTRMARIARLLRAVPELMMIIRAIAVALRSVAFALVLLLGIVYVFGMVFTQAMDGANSKPGSIAYEHFRSLPHTMHTLLLLGAMPDQGDMVTSVAHFNWALYPVMLLYVFLASLTIMNMLIGILCEVVSIVSQVEKEEMLVKQVEKVLAELMDNIDTDGSRSVSKGEFVMLVSEPTWVKAIDKLGVDVFGLIDLADWIFEANEALSFSRFMEIILELRGSNSATVKDIVDLRKLLNDHQERLEVLLRSVACSVEHQPIMTRPKSDELIE
eukprot:TRINITY_DN105902_c0_g1_i1.p1 TRINITY_DN105902_c0_g1~~TRINITY_DN105902_c0_g1_i1.p1  ORF type:complete len:606 (-),score=102.30 TRINITY_DN105902_c0_g1_i1:20-1837(-)